MVGEQETFNTAETHWSSTVQKRPLASGGEKKKENYKSQKQLVGNQIYTKQKQPVSILNKTKPNISRLRWLATHIFTLDKLYFDTLELHQPFMYKMHSAQFFKGLKDPANYTRFCLTFQVSN